MTEIDPPDASPTRIVGGFDRAGRIWVLTLFGIGGAVVGALLPPLARWAGELPWVPFEGPIRLLGSFDDAWLVWGRPALGLVAGLAFAAWVIVDSPVLTISRERVEVQRRGQVERVIERGTVASVRPRGAKTVIEADSGRKLFEDDVEGDKAAVRAAFVDLGYPWEGPLK